LQYATEDLEMGHDRYIYNLEYLILHQSRMYCTVIIKLTSEVSSDRQSMNAVSGCSVSWTQQNFVITQHRVFG